MNSKERLLAAMRRQPVDQVPANITYYMPESCTQKVGPSVCVRELASSRSCAMIDTTCRGGQDGKAVFSQAQVPDCDGGAEG